MKKILIISLIILSMMISVACTNSGNGTNEQPPENIEENQLDINENKKEVESPNVDKNTSFNNNSEEVKELNLDIELLSGKELEYDLDGDRDEREIDKFLSAVEINLDKPIDKMIDEILNHLEINRQDLKEIDFELEMYSKEKIGFKYHVGRDNGEKIIDDFDMDIKFEAGAKWEYEYKLRDSEFKIEYSDGTDLRGKEAQDEMENILSEVTIGLEQSISQLKKDFLAAVNVNEDDITEWDFELKYTTGEKIKAKHDNY